MTTSRYPEKTCAITGIGQSRISRDAGVSALSLTIDAAIEAIRDAGLRREDIDGIASYPGAIADGSGFFPMETRRPGAVTGLRPDPNAALTPYTLHS